MFAKFVLKIEGDDISAVEVLQHGDQLKNTCRMRRDDEFLTPATAAEKQILITDGCDIATIIDLPSTLLSNGAYECLDRWMAPRGGRYSSFSNYRRTKTHLG